jgi:radical SAM protein with 4Fe4S-binding SPASM domain
MPLDECINLIRELASFGVQRLVLSGGEPLIRSDFFEIAHECTERNFKTQVATNATLVTKEGAQALADLSIDAQVSIDGATPNVHDHIRRGLGSFSKAIKGVQSLVRAGVHVTIATVVIKPNFHEIISILDLAEKLEAYEFRLLPFLPIGRGALSEDLHVHPLDIRMLITKLRRLRKKSRIQIAPMEFECTLEKPSQEEPDQQAPIGCDGARHYCTITSSGDVLPCGFFRGVSADSIKDLGFMRIWRNSSFLNYFRSLTVSDIQGKCQLCGWLYDCRGGCLAANYLDGNIFQSNARCWQKYVVKEEE